MQICVWQGRPESGQLHLGHSYHIAKVMPAANAKPKLPNMNEFSPGQLGTSKDPAKLADVLAVVSANQGDRGRLKDALVANFSISRTTDAVQRLNRANNVLIGMSQCQLFDLGTNQLTEFGSRLAGVASDAEQNREFARHLLTTCHGLDLYDVVEVIRARGDTVGLQTIREELRARGFHVTENENNPSKIRMWMEPSGVVDKDWNFSDAVLQKLTGASGDVHSEWRSLTRAQRALLLKLKELSPTTPDWVDLALVKELCELEYGRSIFPEGHLRRLVIDPLVDSDWIAAEGKGKRGGNAGRIKVLPKLDGISIPMPVDAETGIPVDLRAKLATPLTEILADLELPNIAANNHKRGIALELLALRLVTEIGLSPVAFRLRGHETGGGEVDLVANGVHLHYSRWLIQCKNSGTVNLSALAKEIGMAVMLRGHVVALITTGIFASSVKEHARQVEEVGQLQVVLLDKNSLRNYRDKGATAIIDELRAQAEEVLSIKQFQAKSPE